MATKGKKIASSSPAYGGLLLAMTVWHDLRFQIVIARRPDSPQADRANEAIRFRSRCTSGERADGTPAPWRGQTMAKTTLKLYGKFT